MPEPLILTGGSVVTMAAEPRAEALATGSDGRIYAVGDEAAVREAAGDGARQIDLAGQAVVPGFIDAHHHYCLAAFDRRMPDLHLPPGSSIADLLALLEGAVTEPAEGWVRAQGYDPAKLAEHRAPTVAEVDEVCRDRPLLVVSHSFHEGVLNSRGLEEMGWDQDSPDPRNGRLIRDRRGRLTGEVVEQAFFLAEARSRGSIVESGEDAWIDECEAHGRDLLAAGIVRVGDAAVSPTFERLYERAAEARRLPVTVHRMPVGEASLIDPRLDGTPTGSGPGRAPVGPAKLFMDGAERCAICMSKRQLLEATGRMITSAVGGAGLAAIRGGLEVGAIRRGADGMLHRGMLFWGQRELDEAVGKAARHGFQVAQHAIGNEATRVALTAIERNLDALDGAPGRPRLEHVFFLDPELTMRLADSPAVAVVQFGFVRTHGDQLRHVPLWRDAQIHPYRSMLDAGASLAGSSDYPVSPFDVLRACAAAATRRTELGRTFVCEEAISVEEALRAYTVGSARALGVEDEAGTVEPGKRADLVVLSEDPTAVDPDRLQSVTVERTYLAGELAYERCTQRRSINSPVYRRVN